MSEVTRRELLAMTASVATGLALGGATNDVDAATLTDPTLPPVFRPNDTILFQGDSITDGGRQREGLDYNHIMGQDYCYIVAGEILSQFPSSNLTFLNRGISGNTVDDLATRWQTDTLDLKPNLVSILIGVNDASAAYGKIDPIVAATNFQTTYDTLIQQTISALPGVRIVLGQPFAQPVGVHLNDFDVFNALIGVIQDAVESLSTKYKLPFVRYGDMFVEAGNRASPDHWSWDGIHPTYAGHYLMHSLWLDTVSKFYT